MIINRVELQSHTTTIIMPEYDEFGVLAQQHTGAKSSRKRWKATFLIKKLQNPGNTTPTETTSQKKHGIYRMEQSKKTHTDCRCLPCFFQQEKPWKGTKTHWERPKPENTNTTSPPTPHPTPPHTAHTTNNVSNGFHTHRVSAWFWFHWNSQFISLKNSITYLFQFSRRNGVYHNKENAH